LKSGLKPFGAIIFIFHFKEKKVSYLGNSLYQRTAAWHEVALHVAIIASYKRIFITHNPRHKENFYPL
jgi:hypothetical protein